MKQNNHTPGIPVSPALLNVTGETTNTGESKSLKQRLIWISLLAVTVAIAISFIARALVYLINLATNVAFFGTFSVAYKNPAYNHLSLWVIIIPAIGGIIVGLMALYGSKAIRGHGIPEAMEQILVNQSNIRPFITYLKPLSSAIAMVPGGHLVPKDLSLPQAERWVQPWASCLKSHPVNVKLCWLRVLQQACRPYSAHP